MSQSQDFIVPPRSWADIERVAASLRSRFGLMGTPYFPIVEFIEKVLDHRLNMVRFEVGTRREMKGAEGYTCPNGEFIQLRQDVYEGACRGRGRDRFTAAHELGHFAMHTGVPLTRARVGDRLPAFRLAEPQANQFAAALLMPEGFIDPLGAEEAIMEQHGVSYEAAGHRLQYLRRNLAR